jgi:3-oxoacyl-[acyl-carrier protein] reductase
MEISLKGKRAMVCGSTAGIGKAIAQEFAKAGAAVTLIARNEDKLKETLSELEGEGHDYIAADFSKPSGLKEKLENYFSSGKVIHILINNTGGPKGGEAVNAAADEYINAFNQHLVCSQVLVQAAAEGMKKELYGRVINIISTSVKQPIKGLGVSNTIRGAVASWSKTLSSELGRYGITVNNILPGATKTDRLKSIIEAKAKNTGKDAFAVEDEMEKEIPLKRFADPEELAYLAVFLASDKAGYISGVSIAVDGGRTVCL